MTTECPRDCRHKRSARRSQSTPSPGRGRRPGTRDRLVSIAEAVLLSIVALMAAWSGYAAAKWSTESRVGLAEASAARTKANRANLEAIDLGTSTPRPSRRGSPPTPSTTSRRWPLRSIASVPSSASRSTPGAPRSPRRIPTRLGARPTCRSIDSRGSRSRRRWTSRRMRPSPRRERGETSDKYVRTTVFLASVLFLVGISTHFPLRSGRYALVGLGACCWSSPSCSSRSCPARPHDL